MKLRCGPRQPLLQPLRGRTFELLSCSVRCHVEHRLHPHAVLHDHGSHRLLVPYAPVVRVSFRCFEGARSYFGLPFMEVIHCAWRHVVLILSPSLVLRLIPHHDAKILNVLVIMVHPLAACIRPVPVPVAFPPSAA